MSVTNVRDCCWRGMLSTSTTPSKTSRQALLLAAAVTPLEIVRWPSHVLSSPACFTSQNFFHRGRLLRSSVFPFSFDKERGGCALPSGPLETQKGSGMRKNVSCIRSRSRSRIRSEAQEGAQGAVAGRKDVDSSNHCLYMKRTVHNGEVVENSGAVIILGDVEPEGRVLADGDVVVFGRLQGHVHAGRAGDATSRVFATSMEAKEIRIRDSLLSFSTEEQTPIPKMAALASNGSIVILPAVEKAVERQSLSSNRAELPLKVQIPHTDEGFENQSVPLSRTEIAVEVQIPHSEKGLKNQMPARVALLTGIYISVAGIALLGFPKVLFGILFDLEGVKLGWVRVGANLAVVFGVYYIGTAIGDMRGGNGAEAFYFSTVVGRTFLFLSFSWLAVTGAVPRPLLLVGAVNLVGAMLMLKALLKSPPAAQSSR